MNQPLDNIFPYGIPLIIIRHPPQWLQVCVNPLYTKPRFRGVFNIRGTGSYQNYWWFKTQTEAYQQIIENSVTLQGIGNDFEQCQILSTLGWPQCTYIYIYPSLSMINCPEESANCFAATVEWSQSWFALAISKCVELRFKLVMRTAHQSKSPTMKSQVFVPGWFEGWVDRILENGKSHGASIMCTNETLCKLHHLHRFPWSTAQKKAQIVLQQQLSGPNRDLHWPFRNVLSFASNWWCEQLIKVNPLPWNPRSLYPKPIEWKCSFLRKAKRI